MSTSYSARFGDPENINRGGEAYYVPDESSRERRRDYTSRQGIKNPRMGRRPGIANIMQFQEHLYNEFLQLIRLGAYDYVAAEKIGITATTFTRWMGRGKEEQERWQLFADELETDEDLTEEEKDERWREEYKPSFFCRFFLDVMQAKAESRSLREAQVANDSAFQWLRYGPGRTRPGREGWTDIKESLDITLHGDDAAPPIRIAGDGREELGTEDLVETIKVLADALFMPALPVMAQALLEKDPTLGTLDHEPEPANGKHPRPSRQLPEDS